MIKQFKLGDTISRFTKMLHIPHCKMCERRRKILNEFGVTSIKEIFKKLHNCCDKE